MFKELVREELINIIENKKDYFKYFGTDGISFELWLTIELAYKLKDQVKVYCTPSIKSLYERKLQDIDIAEQDLSKRLDLVIEKEGNKCAIEIKIAIPQTLERYAQNCKTDIEKLEKIKHSSITEKLFILLVATRIPSNQYLDGWETWIKEIFGESYDGLVVTPDKFHPRNNNKDHDTSSVNTVLYIKSI
ncbi:hypothetical protein M8G38_12945 [Providencia stuartii]|uniref:hypothetical protein n=1 Tax=Providencia stuartii TaxID=588 RepID=UPI00201DE5BE|nr:hypothetical protein [Providencia stuartii]UQZ10705.1 hypothetical protein M8G38_12945 [Providencia stuartii]